jgi:hypothetical protein
VLKRFGPTQRTARFGGLRQKSAWYLPRWRLHSMLELVEWKVEVTAKLKDGAEPEFAIDGWIVALPTSDDEEVNRRIGRFVEAKSSSAVTT